MPNLSGYKSIAYALMRIFVGLMYWSHGAQKMLGWFGGMGDDGGTVDYMSIFGLAGFVELVFGFLVVIGAFVPLSALIVAVELLGVYFYGHAMSFGGGGFDPFWWTNRGELPAVYFFVFLFIATAGAGIWSVDAWRAKDGSTPT